MKGGEFMRRFTKKIAVLLCVTMVLGSFVSCKKDSGEKDENKTSGTSY